MGPPCGKAGVNAIGTVNGQNSNPTCSEMVIQAAEFIRHSAEQALSYSSNLFLSPLSLGESDTDASTVLRYELNPAVPKS
jgi:hypothetical protein